MSRKTKIRSAASPAYASSSPNCSIQDVPQVEKPLSLTCGVCGASGRYQVGTVTINPKIARSSESGSLEKAVGFTGYFRCRACDAGGPWELPSLTLFRIMSMLGAAIDELEGVPLILGAIVTFDKRIIRYGTEGEAHLKSLIEREPERAFLWVRLGNFYSHARKYEWAEEAYRRALELDPKDIEAHSMFGQLLVDTDRYLEAVPHWHGVLKNVRQATRVRKELRKELVHGAIESLLEAHARSNGQIELLPMPDADELSERRKGKDEPAIIELRNLDLSTEEGFEELCDMFLEPPRRLDRFFPRKKKRVRDTFDDGVVAPIRHTAFSVGRNDPCPCNSGRKYKKCCGR